MSLTPTTANTLLARFRPQGRSAQLATNLASVVLGSLVLAVSAHISVPVLPVPVTLQTFAVALLAASFGARIGVATVALYLVEGLAGLPVFASGGGIGYLFAPSFGFILGALPMAYIIGRAADAGLTRNLFGLFAAMVIGDAVAFGFGFAWLLALSNMLLAQGTALPAWLDASNLVGSAFNGAIKPFVLWDLVKMAFAAATVTGAFGLIAKR